MGKATLPHLLNPALTSTRRGAGAGRAVTKTRQKKARGKFAERIWHSEAVSKALGSSRELPPTARARTTCKRLEEHARVYRLEHLCPDYECTKWSEAEAQSLRGKVNKITLKSNFL